MYSSPAVVDDTVSVGSGDTDTCALSTTIECDPSWLDRQISHKMTQLTADTDDPDHRTEHEHEHKHDHRHNHENDLLFGDIVIDRERSDSKKRMETNTNTKTDDIDDYMEPDNDLSDADWKELLLTIIDIVSLSVTRSS